MGLLNGKVVIITGAGGGIGKAHALAFAQEGAKVVVNDVGASRDGTGPATSMAQMVVDEIKKTGGEAVANFDSIADVKGAENLINTAVKAFGRVDVLVNNAGILRDKTLLKMEDEQWKAVMAVHLDGTFFCGRAAARYMSENKIAGRIINTTSYSGIIGNYGQGNYGAAKAGINALTRIWAMELNKYGITVNAVAPMAKTRMTEELAAVPEDTKAEHISPLVIFLASDLAKEVNGRIFGVHGLHMFEYKNEVTEGVKKDSPWTAKEVGEKLTAISASKATGTAATTTATPTAEAPTDPASRIKRAFELMKVAFSPEASSGWNACLHFFIDGADNYTVEVKNKTVTVQTGTHGTPTCKITTSAEAMASMIEGKLSGQQAFMSGKIKANNLSDMMKYGKVFDFKKARAAAATASTGTTATTVTTTATGTSSAATAPTDVNSRIKRAFDLMSVAFTPEAASGWTACIQFLIEGADSYTIEVKDKKVTVQMGVHGTPTCKVNVGAETMAGMIEGKISGQQAFMSGKIKSNNLSDMMKYGKVFDFKKARAAAATTSTTTAASTGTPATTGINLTGAFEKLPDVFQSDKAAGWNGTISFDITGLGSWTLTIQDHTCKISTGKANSPTCLITGTPEVFGEIFAGKLEVTTASSQGKIKASNPMALVKIARAFDWKSPKLLSATTPSTTTGGLNRAAIGRKYRAPSVFVKPEHILEYARATDDPHPLFKTEMRNKEFMAPPVFPVTLIGQLFREMLSDDIGMDFSRMVHGEQKMKYFDVLRPWDLITPRGVITNIETKGSGELLTFDQYLYRAGELVIQITTSLFVRSASKDKKTPTETTTTEIPKGTRAFTHTITVGQDQSLRYAKASGDNNPIHVDPEVAKAAGFPSVILHGLCTMAFAGQAVTEKVLKGDLKRLSELSVRFSKPVFPNDTLTFEGFFENPQTLTFTASNSRGELVLTNGSARLS